MILVAFSLYDAKSGIYSPPMYFRHTQEAIRACIALGGDMSTLVGRYPTDYHLCEIGTFDDATGVVSAIPGVGHGPVAGFLSSARTLGPLFEAVNNPVGNPELGKEL